MAPPVLEISHLTVSFPAGSRPNDPRFAAVSDVSWSISEGETLAVVGESGSGKSMTALAVLGLLPRPAARVESGEVRFGGRDLLSAGPEELRQVRGRHIAMIFQDPLSALNPLKRIGDQVGEMLWAHATLPRRAARLRAVELLDEVGIAQPERRARQYPHQLSGGMRQRVLIAMALANDPAVLLADEPTTALDVTVQAQILDLLAELQGRRGTAIVLITHDLGVVAGRADRVLVMYGGRVVESADTLTLFREPRHAYTVGLLGSLARLDEERPVRLRPIPGSPPSLLALPGGCPFHPRCPFASQRCQQERPLLTPRESLSHLAACHHSDQVAVAAARELAVVAAAVSPLEGGAR